MHSRSNYWSVPISMRQNQGDTRLNTDCAGWHTVAALHSPPSESIKQELAAPATFHVPPVAENRYRDSDSLFSGDLKVA